MAFPNPQFEPWPHQWWSRARVTSRKVPVQMGSAQFWAKKAPIQQKPNNSPEPCENATHRQNRA
eukprot:CAMPEP_0174379822 /NCGR_PEP_ID=MMETSP0811_2-20130205/122954_1 /TAXON_ID=73025 ORGANISM="Eutreptiella gymnastica-like, Strain CCMP1594" /NCGR_SAMPLE_ID=MMETSP0811_2 /ASSEMBLY_ACC=CAM_ASM_000667 /LENGTH=63 /DNA_ID=CAMNT_0015532467 /DNA_START=643 /DNA_END=834 /DNA_ORIENTATION=-